MSVSDTSTPTTKVAMDEAQAKVGEELEARRATYIKLQEELNKIRAEMVDKQKETHEAYKGFKDMEVQLLLAVVQSQAAQLKKLSPAPAGTPSPADASQLAALEADMTATTQKLEATVREVPPSDPRAPNLATIPEKPLPAQKAPTEEKTSE
jgi:hypothetical protein